MWVGIWSTGVGPAQPLTVFMFALHPQVGTLNYMSPEAIQGGASNPLGGAPLKVGRPSDVWSLGCILYQVGPTPSGPWLLWIFPMSQT